MPTSSNRRFYALIGDQQQGPYSQQELRELSYSGKVNRQTLCWEEGTPEWVPFEKIVGYKTTSFQLPAPPSPVSSAPLSHPPKYRSEGIGFAILAISAIAGIAMWFPGYRFYFSWIIIPFTLTALVGTEAKQLGMGGDDDRNKRGKKRPGPILWGVSMLFASLFCLPSYMYRRRIYGARSLLLPSFLINLFLFTSTFISPDEIPESTSAEVISVAEKIAQKEFLVSTARISSPIEIKYNRLQQKRIARARLTSGDSLDEIIYYSVNWHNARTREFIVTLGENESDL